jgi:hypothetical protein
MHDADPYSVWEDSFSTNKRIQILHRESTHSMTRTTIQISVLIQDRIMSTKWNNLIISFIHQIGEILAHLLLSYLTMSQSRPTDSNRRTSPGSCLVWPVLLSFRYVNELLLRTRLVTIREYEDQRFYFFLFFFVSGSVWFTFMLIFARACVPLYVSSTCNKRCCCIRGASVTSVQTERMVW